MNIVLYLHSILEIQPVCWRRLSLSQIKYFLQTNKLREKVVVLNLFFFCCSVVFAWIRERYWLDELRNRSIIFASLSLHPLLSLSVVDVKERREFKNRQQGLITGLPLINSQFLTAQQQLAILKGRVQGRIAEIRKITNYKS